MDTRDDMVRMASMLTQWNKIVEENAMEKIHVPNSSIKRPGLENLTVSRLKYEIRDRSRAGTTPANRRFLDDWLLSDVEFELELALEELPTVEDVLAADIDWAYSVFARFES